MANTNRVYIRVSVDGEYSLVPDPGEKHHLELWQREVAGYVQSVKMNNGIVLLCNQDARIHGLQQNKAIPCLLGTVIMASIRRLRSGREIYEGFRPRKAQEIIDTSLRTRAENQEVVNART